MANLFWQGLAVLTLGLLAAGGASGLLAACGASVAQGGTGLELKAERASVQAGESVRLAASLNGQAATVEFALDANFTRVETAAGKVEMIGPSTGLYTAPRSSSGFLVRIFARLLGQKTTVATLDIAVQSLASGPSGKLNYSSGSTIWEVDIKTGVTRKLNSSGQDAWFAFGRYWYVDIGTRGGASQDPGPSLFRLDGSGVQEYLHYPSTAFALEPFQPRLNPTGDLITFDMLGSHPKTGESGHFVHIYPNAASAQIGDILRSFAGFERAAWLPVGPAAIAGRLLMMSFADEQQAAGIYITDDRLANPSYLAWEDARFGLPKQAEPSPDGKQIAVVTDNGNLYLADFDGSKLSQVRPLVEAKNGFKVGHPTWSPDGQWLAYFYGGTRQQEIYLQSAQGSASMQILSDIGSGLKAPLSGLAFYQMSWH
jgi:hypothetical protein